MAQNDPLNVTIVGGGLGGLACAIACRRQGFNVTVFDQVQEFLRIGDSIGFGSNSARLLRRWGVGEEMEKVNSRIDELEIYNFDSSETRLGVDDHNAQAAEKYGCRSFIGHRGDFHIIMAEHCKKIGVDLRMGTSITDYDSQKPSVTTSNGDEIISDVVICADGVKSKGREVVLGYEDAPIHSGYAIYRAYGGTEKVRQDPLTTKFTKEDKIRLFLAPDMHGIITTLRNGTEINAVLTHKDEADIEEGWNKPGKLEDVLRLIQDWDPAFRRVWENMENVIDWKLIYRPCLPKWVSDSGLVTLMGDAAHPFLPTSVQGASQAIEDGATIAKCLAKAGKGNVALALHTFFELRHDYVEEAQATGIRQRDTWHNLHDKESKQFKELFDTEKTNIANVWLWANDAEKVVDEKWDDASRAVKARLSAKL